MAIDMSTVKDIVYNNKHIKKIEDGQGNILWQYTPGPTPTRDILYFLNGSTAYKLDMENKIATQYSVSGGTTGNGGHIVGTNSKLYKFVSGNFYPITIDDTNSTITFGSSECSVRNSNYNGNAAYCYPATVNSELYTTNTQNTTTKYVQCPVPPDGWTVTDLTDSIKGNCTFIYNGIMYGSPLDSGTSLSAWDPNTNSWVSQSVFTNLPSSCYAYHVWVLGRRVFCDNTGIHREYNFNTNTWDVHTWTGLGNFNGSRVFTDGVDTYQVGGTGTSTSIYILNPSTDTWTSYWTFPTSIRGDYIFNSKGSAQLGQNSRPRLA